MYEIFNQLLQKYGLTPYKVSKEIGVSQSTLSDWKLGKITPKTDTLKKIADYFGVTVDYLVIGSEPKKIFDPKLTPKDERDIIKKVDDILSQLNSGEALMFDGAPMNDETMELLRASLENSVKMAKITAKKKYTPKKYRK
ncbi:MAG: helix-turn-helix transcriptional regulator [Lachnospiraceae bacterium]|nr:helix-turn-helix transcriptional regulator [Lachnospiraceae bacterium]